MIKKFIKNIIYLNDAVKFEILIILKVYFFCFFFFFYEGMANLYNKFFLYLYFLL